MNDTDELGRKLLDWFGREAAEREQRAIAESGVDPVEAVDRVLDIGERWKA